MGNLVSTNLLSTQGINVSSAETKILILEKENQILSVKIEEASGLKDVEQMAQAQGFVRISNVVFAPTPDTFALR